MRYALVVTELIAVLADDDAGYPERPRSDDSAEIVRVAYAVEYQTRAFSRCHISRVPISRRAHRLDHRGDAR